MPEVQKLVLNKDVLRLNGQAIMGTITEIILLTFDVTNIRSSSLTKIPMMPHNMKLVKITGTLAAKLLSLYHHFTVYLCSQ